MAVSAGMALLSTGVSAAAGSFAFGTVAGWSVLGSAALTHFLVTTAMGAALNALSPKPNTSGASGYTVTATGSALDHQIIYGRVKAYGVRVFDTTTGDSNKYLHRVIAIAGHRIEAYDQVWINDSYINFADIDVDGNIPSVVDADGSTSTRYNGKMRIKFHYGTDDQLADTDLVSESGGLWTSDHRLRGIAYIYIRMEFNQDVYPNGIPEIGVVVRGKRVYDPRSDTTYYSSNPALCIRDYLTNSKYGLGESADSIDDDLVGIAANVCRYYDYPTLTGERRYTLNGAFTTGTTPYDLLQSLLSSMGGLLWYAQGKWRMKPAYWTPAVHSFNEDDLRSGISVNTRHSRRDNFNTVNGTWKGEETNWQVTDFTPVTNAGFIAADNGQEKSVDISLPFTTDFDTARRIANIYLERNRQQLTVSASFGMRAFQVQVGDVIELNNTRFGWVDKEFEVVSWTFGLVGDSDLQVQMTLREITSSVFDDISDGAVYERDNTSLASPFLVEQPTLDTPVVSTYVNDDGTNIPLIKFSWSVVEDVGVEHYEFQWKPSTASTWSSIVLVGKEFTVNPALSDTGYDYRVRAVNHFGVRSGYASSVSPVSTGTDTTIPKRPTWPTTGALTPDVNSVKIKWVAPTQNTDNSVLNDLFNYKIYRNTVNNSSTATLVGSVGADVFTDSSLAGDPTYYYWVSAVDTSGNESSRSVVKSVNVPSTYPVLLSGVYYIGVTTFPTSSSEVNTAFVAELGDSPSDGAQVWFYTGTLSNPTEQRVWLFNGTSWDYQEFVVDGDIVVSGTITGNKLAATNIITSTAQIGNGLITTAKIGDAEVSTLKIAGRAVTIPATVDGTLKVGAGSSTWYDMCSVTLNLPEAQPILINWSVEQYYSGTPNWGLWVLNNGSTVYQRTAMAATSDFPSGFFQINGVSGNNTILLRWYGGSSSVSGIGHISATGFIR